MFAKVIAPESEINDIHDLVVDVDESIDETKWATAGPIDGRYDIVPRDEQGRRIPGATVDPAEAHVTIPIIRVASSKTTPISPTIVGRPSATAAITGAVVNPPFVTLSGAADDLAKISVIMTSPIDVSGASGDIRRATTLITPAGITVSTSKNVIVTVHIGAISSQGNPPERSALGKKSMQ
jgi:YbbR domain-containing protein